MPSYEDALEESGDAFFKHDHFVFHPGFHRFALQQLQRLFDRLVREAEGSVVHGDHPAGFEIEKGAGSVGRTGVDVAELLWIVGSNGKQRQLRREAASDFAEARKVSGVSGMVDGVFAAAQHVASITTMRIFQDARSPVPRRDVSNVERYVAISVPPLQFNDLFVAQIRDEIE